MLNKVIEEFNLQPGNFIIAESGQGLINKTWKVEDKIGGKKFILQCINEKIFHNPLDIAFNIRLIGDHLTSKHSNYLFTHPIKSRKGTDVIKYDDGWYRLFPFIAGSHTVDTVDTPAQAYEAARLFGEFTKKSSGIKPSALRITLPDFHNLALRFQQFEHALLNGNPGRIRNSQTEIDYLLSQKHILEKFNSILPHLIVRVTHHDTKISNVLFDENNKGMCVIDLDTIMPGYFISDVGDMMRTYLCPFNEEEKEFTRISIRKDFYEAIIEGYLSEMSSELNEHENKLFHFAGQFMIYMQALRFLTDHFNNDRYYGAKYEGHNFIRAGNQVALLQRFNELQ